MTEPRSQMVGPQTTEPPLRLVWHPIIVAKLAWLITRAIFLSPALIVRYRQAPAHSRPPRSAA
jgi:hypothetical protein